MPRVASSLLAAAVLATLALVPAAAASAATSVSATISISPTSIDVAQLNAGEQLTVRYECGAELGAVTLRLARPDGVTSTLLNGYQAPGTALRIDVGLYPADPGTYTLTGTSTGCPEAAQTTLTVTGERSPAELTFSPSLLSRADFSDPAKGVLFTGTGFQPGERIEVTSTAPGVSPESISADDDGAFTFRRVGPTSTPPGLYVDTFAGEHSGRRGGSYTVDGPPAPTVRDPRVTIEPTPVSLAEYRAGGVTLHASGYLPGDFLLVWLNNPTSSYLRGFSEVNADGELELVVSGEGEPDDEHLGAHWFEVERLGGETMRADFEVVEDPIVPEPSPELSAADVRQGEVLEVEGVEFPPGVTIVLAGDVPLPGEPIEVAVGEDGAFSAEIEVPRDYPLGPHTITASQAAQVEMDAASGVESSAGRGSVASAAALAVPVSAGFRVLAAADPGDGGQGSGDPDSGDVGPDGAGSGGDPGGSSPASRLSDTGVDPLWPAALASGLIAGALLVVARPRRRAR